MAFFAYVPPESRLRGKIAARELEAAATLTAYACLGVAEVPRAFCAVSGRLIRSQKEKDVRGVKVVDFLP